MLVLGVDDLEAWHQRVRSMKESREFEPMDFKPPEPVDDSRVLHVWDPSGVRLVFVP